MAKVPAPLKTIAHTLHGAQHAAPAKLVAAKLVDVLLIGSSVAAAAGSVVFAGFMVMQGDHPPNVNGLQYLGIFAQPKGVAKIETGRSFASGPPVDMSPVGAIGASPESPPPQGSASSRSAAAPTGGYQMVSAQPGMAWIRQGGRVFSVRPGDDLPGLGLVRDVTWSQGRWAVVGDNGETLLTAGAPTPASRDAGKAPFARDMIFGPNN